MRPRRCRSSRQRRPRTVHGATHVHYLDLPPRVGIGLDERSGRSADGGIVHQSVDGTHLGDHRFDGMPVCDICGDRWRPATMALQQRDGLVELTGGTGTHGDGGARGHRPSRGQRLPGTPAVQHALQADR
jgi:hypothetical protein